MPSAGFSLYFIGSSGGVVTDAFQVEWCT